MMYKLPGSLCRFAAVTFEEFLINKKIDSALFQQGNPALWKEWNILFDQMSVNSFTSQKLYLINPIRRKYLLKEVPSQSAQPSMDVAPVLKKPIFRPKIN